jgi:hypothetical protein
MHVKTDSAMRSQRRPARFRVSASHQKQPLTAHFLAGFAFRNLPALGMFQQQDDEGQPEQPPGPPQQPNNLDQQRHHAPPPPPPAAEMGPWVGRDDEKW